MRIDEKNYFGGSLFHQTPFRMSQLRREGISIVGAVSLAAISLLSLGCGITVNPLPQVSMSPTSLFWHKVAIGQTSGAQTITITNNATSSAETALLQFESIELSDNFIETANTCPAAPMTLGPGASCTISVAFRPQVSGAVTGTLTLTDNAKGKIQTVPLTATGGIGSLLFDPTSLSFPGIAANTVSQPQTAKLTNEQTTPVTIAAIVPSAHFGEGDNCPISPNTLPAGESCSVTVTSNPVAAGDVSGAINVKDNLGNVTQLYLTGSDKGQPIIGALSFSPSTLQWGKVAVGATAAPKTITVTNNQSSGVTFSAITTARNFSITDSTCPISPAVLAGGASCTVSLVFRPSVSGSISELLLFADNAAGSPQAVSLKATGILGSLLFTPTSLSFAGVDPGTISPAQTATLTNVQSADIAISAITSSGHFAQTNNCPATLGPQASCTFQVTANPIADGLITGSINVKDGAGNTTQLYLKGQGGNTDQILSFSPDSIVWGNIAVGQTSGAKTLTVNNGQNVPLTIYSISIGQDFIINKSNCPLAPETVAAQTSCTITLNFRPYSAGAKNEEIIFTDDAPGGQQPVPLSGTGFIGSLLFKPVSLSFAGVEPNTVSQPQTAILTNEQASDITLADITLSGHFAQTNDCAATLSPQASCTFTVTSNPVIDGSITGSVNVKDGSGNTTQLYLFGMGGVPIVPGDGNGSDNQITVAPQSVQKNEVQVGQTSGATAVTLSNPRLTPLTISSISLGPDLIQTANTCPAPPAVLAAGAACTVSVAFRPVSAGLKTESVTFIYGSPGESQSSVFTGTGVLGALIYSPTAVTFPPVATGTVSPPTTVELTNLLSEGVTLKSITMTGPFAQTNDCPTAPETLAGGTSCKIRTVFTPQAAGSYTGAMTVKQSSGEMTQLYLSGAGSSAAPVGQDPPSVAFSPTILSWGNIAVGQTSGAKSVTLTNNQTASLAISSITVGSDFVLSSNTCPTAPSTLSGGASCNFSVSFQPHSPGVKSEPIVVMDNAAGNPHSIAATGTAITGSLIYTPTSLSFAPVAPGNVSPSQTAKLVNTTATPISLARIASSGHFAQTNDCPISPQTLAANGSCTLAITSNPISTGAFTGAINATNSTGNVTQLYLSGSGSFTGVTVSPKTYSFSSVNIGTSSLPVHFSLTNGQPTTLSISQISLSSPDFSQTNNCAASLAPGASCVISVTFAPASSGLRTATLVVNDNASNTPQTATVSGTGTISSGGKVLFKPGTTLGFTPQIIGRTSVPQKIMMTNAQTSTLFISSITTSGSPVFGVSNTCIPKGQTTGTLSPFASCSISVTFNPAAAKSYSGAIAITDNGAGSPQTISFFGQGITADTATKVFVMPISSCALPSTSQQFSARVTNTGNPAVDWYVDNVKGGTTKAGLISPAGVYQAPNVTGTHTVSAISQANQTASASTTIAVTNTPTFAISPFTSSIPTSEQQQFQAQICSVPDGNGVTYTVDDVAGGNANVGTITNDGLYTAPRTPGKHTVRVADSVLGKSSGAVVTVYSALAVDFGSRTNTQHAVQPEILGANHVDSLHKPADIAVITDAGIKLSRTYALIPTVYATQTPNWSKIDALISNLQAAGMHVILQMAYTPTWLQPNPNPCGSGSTAVMPTNINSWAQIAASYVAHMDATFPGVVTDYEIENEPDAGGLCGVPNKLDAYLSIYAAAAPLMKQQAASDGMTIRIGGPSTTGLNTNWIPELLSNPSTAPFVDFVSYHNYIFGTPNLGASWDTYNGVTSVYQQTQGAGGPAAVYTRASAEVAAGKQPLGAKTPIYIDEYNINWAAMQECCRNDPLYAPLWNALYVSDLLNTAYSGVAAVPSQLTYFSANAYPYQCLIGTWDTHMDCEYEQGSSPAPYPQYYAQSLIASSRYLGLNEGGFMANSVSPPTGGGGLSTTAWYTASRDSVLIVNPTETDYSQLTINFQNVGFSSPHAVIYRIVSGDSITSSSLMLNPTANGYSATISVPAYSVFGIAIQQ